MHKEELNLSERKQNILMHSVEYYIAAGVPISSQELAKQGTDFKLSSASIRSELANLEELGYLTKLHTSGGRVPTTKGYQLYVMGLINSLPKDKQILNKIKKSFSSKTKYISEVIKETAKVVSETTNYPAVVLMDGLKNFIIENIKIAPLLSGQAFVLIETNAGIIDPIIIPFNSDKSGIETDISLCFTSNFKGKTLGELISNAKTVAKDASSDLKNYETIFNSVIKMLENYVDLETKTTYSTGAKNVLAFPEMKNSEDAQKLIEYIESKDAFKDDNVKKLNNELDLNFENTYAVVKTKCKLAGVDVASLAVVGPKRMDYLKIASALSLVAKEFSNMNMGGDKTR